MVDEFEAEVKAALRAKRALDRHMARMYELLPDIRRSGKGPTAIEQMTHRLIPRDTASRVTAPVIGTSRKPKDAAA